MTAENHTNNLARVQLGHEIARLRTQALLSRPQLVAKLHKEIDPSDPMYDKVSELWIKRIENGQVVNLSLQVLEVMCLALRCTGRERMRILRLAERHVLIAAELPDEVIDAVADKMARAWREAAGALAALQRQPHATKLTKAEIEEISQTLVNMIAEELTRQDVSGGEDG